MWFTATKATENFAEVTDLPAADDRIWVAAEIAGDFSRQQCQSNSTAGGEDL